MTSAGTGRVFALGVVGTVMEEAARRAAQGVLEPWDSVAARKQTAGRGRWGRRWESLPGNLFCALRLPARAPWNDTRAGFCTALVLCEALRARGADVRIKWPNDLALLAGGRRRKCCGILVQAKGKVILAGIGLNIASAPASGLLREGAALPAGCLADLGLPGLSGNPLTLWTDIAPRFPQEDPRLEKEWRSRAERLLLWKDEPVVLEAEGRPPCSGVLRGLREDGAALLETEEGIKAFTAGSLRRRASPAPTMTEGTSRRRA